MDPSRRRIRRSPHPPPPPSAQGGIGEDDLISALPDDMLLQVLARLGCARVAARTGVLSRRWRGLWICLPGLPFCDFPASKVQAALARVAGCADGPVTTLDIRLARSVPPEAAKCDDVNAKKLLLYATRLSPEELVFILPRSSIGKPGRCVGLAMPSFCRATSIELDTYFLCIHPPASPDSQLLPALERMFLSGNIVNIGAFLNHCPRLRVLRVTIRGVGSGLLEEALAALEAVVALRLTVSLLGIELDLYNGGHMADRAQFVSLLRVAARVSP